MCKYSRVNQSVVHHVCSVSSESDGIQTVGLTEEHKPLRFTRAHSHASLQIENGLGWQAFVLSFGLFVSCTCIFIMYLFLLQYNSLFISHIVLFYHSAEMKQSAINMPTLYTEPIVTRMQVYMLKGRKWVSFCPIYLWICCSLVCAGWIWWQISCLTHA